MKTVYIVEGSYGTPTYITRENAYQEAREIGGLVTAIQVSDADFELEKFDYADYAEVAA